MSHNFDIPASFCIEEMTNYVYLTLAFASKKILLGYPTMSTLRRHT